ncbi:MAG TPA: hypothetical protein VH063_10735 [Gaiellaceae bacterium]|jgi:hypothetical protein|nr:hypothetical protein [Gaiellaceae bacterium]
MHPELRQRMLIDTGRELNRKLEQAERRREAARPSERPPETVTLRLCCVGDDDTLARLAALEGVPVPKGRHVVAEVGGLVVAAMPVGVGRPLADPFRRTAHLMPLLELRVAQLTDEPRRHRRLARWGSVRRLSRA